MIAWWLVACGEPTQKPPVDPPVVDTDVVDTDVDSDPPAAPACGDAGVLARVGAAVFPSLQAAIDAAGPGDTVTVCAGEHGTTARWAGPGPLVIVGEAPGAVTLRGVGAAPILDVLGPTVDLTLRDLVFTGVRSERLPAVTVRGYPERRDGAVVVEGCRFEDNQAPWPASAMWLSAVGEVVVRDSRFAGNEAPSGPALLIEAPARRVDVERVTAEGNTGGRSGGVGVHHSDGSGAPLAVRVVDSVFRDNVGVEGGLGTALFVDVAAPGSTTVWVEGSRFERNHELHVEWGAWVTGGAVYIGDHAGPSDLTVDLVDDVFDGNTGVHMAHLALGHVDVDRPMEVRITGGAFWRGDAPVPFLAELWEGEAAPGAAIAAFLHQTTWAAPRVTLTDVDVGAGPTANAGQVFSACGIAYEGLVSGELDAVAGRYCP